MLITNNMTAYQKWAKLYHQKYENRISKMASGYVVNAFRYDEDEGKENTAIALIQACRVRERDIIIELLKELQEDV